MEKINAILEYSFLGNSLKQYLIAFGIVIGALILSKLLYNLLAKTIRVFAKKTKNKLDDLIVERIKIPFVLLVGIIGLQLAKTYLKFPEKVDYGIEVSLFIAIAGVLAYAISGLASSLIDYYLEPFVEKTENTIDDLVLPMVKNLVIFLIWYIAFIQAVKKLGGDPTSLLAGLGIGGLALAMASKDTVSNLFGGLTILIDRPFTMKDRIKVSGIEGVVIAIGLRCTRLKTDEGVIVTIPNSKFSSTPIENKTNVKTEEQKQR